MLSSRASRRSDVKPVVVDYNQLMNGVDLADQFTVYSKIKKVVEENVLLASGSGNC